MKRSMVCIGMLSFENYAFKYSTRFDVYETLCPQQMLVHKSGQIKNKWGVQRCHTYKIAVSSYSKSTSKSKSAKGDYSKKIK